MDNSRSGIQMLRRALFVGGHWLLTISSKVLYTMEQLVSLVTVGIMVTKLWPAATKHHKLSDYGHRTVSKASSVVSGLIHSDWEWTLRAQDRVEYLRTSPWFVCHWFYSRTDLHPNRPAWLAPRRKRKAPQPEKVEFRQISEGSRPSTIPLLWIWGGNDVWKQWRWV